MATTWYIDFEGGNNANAGTSFATRKKTLTNITTAAPGDTIRIMASKDPTSIGSSTWTNLSKTVTIPSNLTLNIDLCDSAWTASANVTCTTSTTNKQGTNAASMAIAAAFTTGKVAYKTISTTDFSGYQQVSYWIRTSAAIAASVLELRLCSDTIGAVTVNTIAIPAISTTGRYTPVTIDTAGALGASIQSVALYALSDPGTVTVLLDNIIACKASSSADSITLTSLISKNTATESWHGIKSINGTTVTLDNAANGNPSTGQGYYGATETVTTYKRETVPTAISATSDLTNANSGLVTSPITISGGWNRTDMSTQTGATWITCHNGAPTGITMTNVSYVDFSKINVIRASDGFFITGTDTKFSFTDCAFNNNDGGVFVTDTSYGCTYTNLFCVNNGTSIVMAGSNVLITNFISNSNTIGLTTSMKNSKIIGATINNNFTAAIRTAHTSTLIRNLTTSSNPIGIDNVGDVLILTDSLIGESTEVTSSVAFSNNKVYSHNHDQTTDNHKIYMDGALISSETGSDRRTASGIAWKIQPTSDNRSSTYPVSLEGIKVACRANDLVTVSVWCKRSNTGATGRLLLEGGQIAGASADVSATTVGAANTYEQLTITFTPTAAGVVDVLMQAYGGTTYSVWFDDVTITQA